MASLFHSFLGVPNVHFVSAIFVTKGQVDFCQHLVIIYFIRILICIKLTQPEEKILLFLEVNSTGDVLPLT